MVEIGYKLSSEEHGPNDLIRYAKRAEEVGFTFAMISDHYHPWVDRQGHSPFVWGVLGGIAQINKAAEAGYTHVWVHQIGPDQTGFFRFYERGILPKLHRA
jgi:hypothetical protein